MKAYDKISSGVSIRFVVPVAIFTIILGLINMIMDAIVLKEFVSYQINSAEAYTLLVFLLVGSLAVFVPSGLLAVLSKLTFFVMVI
jgi:hypothetical protein